MVGAHAWMRAVQRIHLIDQPSPQRLILGTCNAGRHLRRGEADACRNNPYRLHQ
jgi:hypothetical protein